MINKDRIVPVTKSDLLSLYGTILTLQGQMDAVLAANDAEGNFSVTVDDKDWLANQPVRTLDFASGVTGGLVYFVAAYDFEGITVNGAAATIADGSATVQPDGATLYKAVLSSGSVTISAVTPVVA